VLLSRDEAYTSRRSITVAPVTTRVRNLPVEVSVGPPEGLTRSGVINVDDINMIRKASLVRRITRLSAEKLDQVAKAIKFALALP
jgi:mRNA interferase MazF